MERSSSQESPELEDLALRDDLTGAWNRRYLRRLLDEDWAALVATQGTITLLVLDLDFFKEINDSHGHLAGDHVLQRATNQLRASFRAEDRLIRYGGDEFVVALFGVGAEEARSLAERARTALRTVDIVTAEGGETVTLPLSFSMGVASFPADGAAGEEILALADRRLYEEKRARRLPAATADRGRRRLLLAAGLALAVLVFASWIEVRRLRKAPPMPAGTATAAEVLSPPEGAAPPLTEIVVRDEEELTRLREEVRRLQVELAEPRPVDDRGRYEARIRELEARLTEAGDVNPLAAGFDAAGSAGLAGAVGAAAPAGHETPGAAGESVAGMQIGERRTREGLDPSAPAPLSPERLPAAGSAGNSVVGVGGEQRIEPPQLLRAIRPDYPRIARARRRMATVEVKVRVDASGKVLSAEPVGPPAGFGFDESAREAALSAQFRPGRRDGVAVEMEIRLAIRFLLEGPPR